MAALTMTACGSSGDDSSAPGGEAETAGDGGATDAPAASGETYELTFATFTPDPSAGNPSTAVGAAWLDAIEERSGGRITFERHWAEAVCPAAELATCVSDGRADVVLTAPAYNPSVFPLTNVTGLLFTGEAGQDVVDAYEALRAEYPAFDDELAAVNSRFAAIWPPGRAILGTTKPIESVDDLDGTSLRATGSLATALSEVGGDAVAMTAGETYEAVERGVVDGYAQDLTSNIDFNLHEVATHLTDPGIGQYTVLLMLMNEDAYQRLDGEMQQVVDDVVADFADSQGMDVMDETVTGKCEELIEVAEIESFTAWGEEETQRWSEAARSAVFESWRTGAAEAGVDDPQTILDAYLAALEDSPSAGEPDAAAECVDRWNDAAG